MKQITYAVFAVLVVTASACAQCVAPRYRVGKILADDFYGISMQISIDVADFAPPRLICLAGALKQRYSDRKGIHCAIFSDGRVAQQYVLLTSIEPSAVMFRRTMFRHAIYSFERDQGDQGEHLYINPDPLQDGPGSSTETSINLQSAGTPQCKIQLNGRCLLVLPPIWPFQHGSDDNEQLGSVTLTGKVAPSGRVGGIYVVDSRLGPGEDSDFLKKVAIQNLRAWRFETAGHPDAIRITYDYHYTTPGSGIRTWQMPVQMEQPDKNVVELKLSIMKP